MILNTPDRGGTGPESVGIPTRFNLRCERVWSLAEVAPILECLVTEMILRGYPRQDTFAARLALEEAVVNAIRHGHRGREGQPVQVSYLVTDAWLLVEVEDQGPGFDLHRVPDPVAEENLEKPSGRGLLLMREYMNWVRFFGRGNVVTMCRQRSPA
jgi:serine/threonine-protein kinase RsbW